MAKSKRKSMKATNGSEAKKPEKREVHVLSRRDCKLPRSIHFRTQDHGDDPVQATDIRVSEIELTQEEANALLQEPYACRGLFLKAARGKPERPLLAHVQPLKLAETIESAKVSLFLGANAGGELKLGVCKLKAVTLEPKVGGVVHMSCLVQATPALDKRIGDVVSRMDTSAQITLAYEHNAEQLEADVTAEQPAKGDPENAKFEEDAKAQVDAWNRGSDVAGDAASTEAH